MSSRHTGFFCALVSLALATGHAAPAAGPPPPSTSLLRRVDQTGFVRVEAPSFQSLTPKQQALAYWLTQAAIAIDPIVYDQLSAFGLREKRLLEEIVAHPAGIPAPRLQRITRFTELFWANRGNHNETTAQKFLPDFDFDTLKQAALTAQRNGAMRTVYGDLPALPTPQQLTAELEALRPALFDPGFEPMNTAKSPSGGKDIIQASANTFYPGLSLADLLRFHDEHPLNSRVVKDAQGHLHELVYRAGTPDGKVPPGIYAPYLRKANEFLTKARTCAEPAQAQVIGDLIRYYQTGDPQDWLKFDADWVQNDAPVDFSNGFVEVYRDARGLKGSSAAFVSITDQALSATMGKLAANAAYFEQKAPWAPQYRKQVFRAPVIKAVEMLIETGDFHVSTVGDNLPNENAIREKFGSKNFLITSSSRALNEFSLGPKIIGEFGPSAETIARDDKYGVEAYGLMVALHEVIGHGSGKLSPKFAGGSEHALKEYYSTLEEGRADLMALWNVWDPKLAELGLISNQAEVAKAMYDTAAVNALRQLRNVKSGETLEEDHARDRQMIVNYIMSTTGGIEQFKQGGKTYIRVSDYQKMRQGVGKLLAELMRIKAEGDYAAIKALVDKYGVHFDPVVRDEVVARFNALDMPTYFEGISARLSAVLDAGGGVKEVLINYPASPKDQFLGYAAMYDESFVGQALFRAPQ
jgi:dipeptidyl-peptidase III